MSAYTSNKAIGLTEERTFDERVIYVNRVARVVKGGRRFRFQALVLVGDHKGQVGVGVSKGADVSAAVTKATGVAKKHLTKLPIYKGTLAHEVEAKVGGAHILILPAAPGTGLIAGGIVRTILEVSGFENALSKSFGSSNRINTAYATLAALQSMVSADKWVTRVKQSASQSTVDSHQLSVKRKIKDHTPKGKNNE
ncbi:30S ribosomal protein S5 [Candidatus Saccharibacteria bacterium]|nr:30S ribosomal protein S5 [Candidatus Saccharibacteria bacterium]